MLNTRRAVKFLVVGPIILAFLLVLNVLTWNGHWWVQWAALGLGIAWVANLLTVLRAIVVGGGLAAAGAVISTYLLNHRR